MEKHIRETLISVKVQSDRNFEVICLDDGSTDATVTVIQSEIRGDGRFRVVKGPARGVSAARNEGLKIATGEYVLFLDADDLLSPDALERFRAALEQSDVTAALGGVHKITEAGSALPGADNRTIVPEDNHIKALLQKNFVVNGGNLAIRRKAAMKVGGYDEDLRNGEDWEFWCRLAVSGDFAVLSGPPVLAYRQVETGANFQTRASNFARDVPCLRKIAANPEMKQRFGRSLGRLVRARRIDIFWSGVRNRYQYGQKGKALLFGAAGAFLYPDSLLRPRLVVRFFKSVLS